MEHKNKLTKRLTVVELRNCREFETYSDEQAEETIKSLEKVSLLFYELYIKYKQMQERISCLLENEVWNKKKEFGSTTKNKKAPKNERKRGNK